MTDFYPDFKRRLRALLALSLSAAGMSAAEPPAAWDFDADTEGFVIINTDSNSDEFSYNRWDKAVVYNGSYGDVADDYLALPPLTLKAGKSYEVRYTAYAEWWRVDWEPRLSWRIGTEATAEALQRVVADPVLFTSSSSGAEYSFTFSVDSDGEYYLAAYLSADEAQGSVSFYIENIEVGSGVSADAPAAPGLSVSPAIRGGVLVADITLTAPTATIGGGALAGELDYSVADISGRYSVTGKVMPGAVVNLSDEGCGATGTTYTASVSQGETVGKEASVKFSPEFDRPSAPANVRVTREGEALTISWDPVVTGLNGGLFNPATVVYSVQRDDRSVVATKVSATSVTDTPAIPAEGQTYVSYTVTAYGSADTYTGSDSESDAVMLGNPYTGRYAESFAGAEASTLTWCFGPEGASYSAWRPASSSYSSPVCREGQDGDGGFLLFTPSTYSDGTEYISPLIDMTGASNPTLEFHIFRYASAPDAEIVSVSALRGDVAIALGGLNFKAEADGWEKVSMTLPAEVAAGPFSLVFAGIQVSSAKAAIDNIVVRDLPAVNLGIRGIEVEPEAYPGQKLDIIVTVVNDGSEDVADGRLTLGTDSGVVAEQSISLASGSSVAVPFSLSVTPFMAGRDLPLTGEVSVEGDAVATDDSATATVAVSVCDLPVAGGVTAVHGAGGAEIGWNAPEIDASPAPEAMTESFEEWMVGSTEARGGWVFVDVDGKPKYGLAGVNEDKPYAFFVADKFSTSAVSSIEAADGINALVTTKNSDYSDTDTWLISPEIDPSHPVSFKATAMGFRGYAPAEFELGWLPAGSVSKDDFVKIKDVSTGGYEWETVDCEFPAQASRFAIHISGLTDNACAFDDFRFYGVPEVPVLAGYNIYRNGTFLAALGPDSRAYTDGGVDPAIANRYHVSCRYTSGREAMEPEGYLLSPGRPAGIDAAGETLKGFVVDGCDILAAGDLEVYTPDGLTRGKLRAGTRMRLAPGVYIVKADGKISKILVN